MRLFVGLARNPLDSCLARPPRGNNRVYIVRDSAISSRQFHRLARFDIFA